VSGTAKAGTASLWRSVRMVAWSFFGIRKGSESQEDMARVNPFHIIAVGLAAAALFVVSLVILVNWVVAK
jgi:hypothetical protein